jgi:hypothetical protein
MSAVSTPADAIICSKCAFSQRLKVLSPCPLHLSTEEDSNQYSLADTYLYDSTLSESTIRLLQLEPGSGDDPIRCSMVVKSLGRGVIYNALSYTWGDSNTKQEIFCDGLRLDITQNLHAALRQLREDDRTQLLWVDAVCINQVNTPEKTA